ncbi:hypothetical protein FHS31_000597 [Sphingomonas vulcanisoli]|uniref:DUF4174 domain-containing protein n=1 Tax=Sphingomonas vulcanisoli TaxID=1658060 RepID=A0ABX0TTA5_9SPHN|nr:DUF4174 domain-containing protein [Sphingomonas vulcanisoli]NIJ07015.1 hypothetical protein [Sphingomonas vulcanisoli]
MRLLPLIALIATPAMAGEVDIHSVSGMQDHYRVLLAFAPHLNDPRLHAQSGEMAKFGPGAAERDLLFVQVADDKVLGAHDKAAKLRAKYHVGPNDYRAFLIGKDGNAAMEANGPIPAARLQAAIDAMPMRKAEMARAHAGLGKPKP